MFSSVKVELLFSFVMQVYIITEYILSKQKIRFYHVSGNVSRRLVVGPLRFQGLEEIKVTMSNLPHHHPELDQKNTMSKPVPPDPF